MAETKRYYWIKLKTDFFDQDKIDFLMGQENGAEYVVIYQMLMLKTAQQNGLLATQTAELMIPYDIKKIVRDTKYFDFDTVTVALELFKKLGLIYEEENHVLKLANADELVGSEGKSAQWMRDKRARDNANKLITSKSQSEIEKDIDKEIEKDIDIEIDKKKDKKKTDTEIIDSILESISNDDLKNALSKFVDARKKMKKALTGYAFELAYKKLQDLSPSVDEQIEIVNQAIMNGWQSFYPLKKNNNNGYHTKPLPNYMKEVSNNPFLDMLEKENDQ